ncbi:HtaA domain-containing protein [Microbacterium oleivorans]|uniref:HtaA domain-containing protein n=1 Tax=Microbacterium oleivorans TaxID=273677 RepID=UPI0018D2C3D1|nr:HtaA domain-containing protein [Microbacterium oleivorans]
MTALPAHAAPRTCTVTEAKVLWDAGAADVQPTGSVTAADAALTFDGGAGVLEPVRPSGSLSFDGTVAYTSAAGVETTLSAPTLVIDGGSGTLLFDVQPEGTELIPQAALAEVDLRAVAVSESGDTINLDGVDAQTDATADGSDLLWAGTLGDLDLTVTADCTTIADTAVVEEEEQDAAASGILVPLIVVGIAATVTVVLAVGSVQRRKRNSARAAQPETVGDPLP